LYSASGGGEESLRREARSHVERALALGVSDPLVLSWAGHALGDCGFWQDAERYAQRAVDLNPNIAAGRVALAMVCVRLKRCDDVIRHIDALESFAPRGSWTHTGIAFRGLAHYMAGRYEPALQAMEKALLLRPDFVYPLKDIAVTYEKLGRREEACDAVRRLRSADPIITLERIEAFNLSSLIPPDVATDMNKVFRKVWKETEMQH
jgi:tetratricopeptide (TPR) repeat protein